MRQIHYTAVLTPFYRHPVQQLHWTLSQSTARVIHGATGWRVHAKLGISPVRSLLYRYRDSEQKRTTARSWVSNSQTFLRQGANLRYKETNKQTNKQPTDRPTIQTNVRFVQNRMQQMSIYLRNDRISTRPDGMVPVSWLLSKSSRAAINSDWRIIRRIHEVDRMRFGFVTQRTSQHTMLHLRIMTQNSLRLVQLVMSSGMVPNNLFLSRDSDSVDMVLSFMGDDHSKRPGVRDTWETRHKHTE